MTRLGLACALACLFGACARGERPLVLWHAYRGAEEQALLAAVEAFRQTSPRPVEVLGVPSETLAAKLTSAIPRGHGPDVFIFAHERIGGWAEAGLLAPANPTEPGAFLPETRRALTWDGALLAYPLAFKSLALFLNTKLREAPPETLSDLATRDLSWPAAVFPLGYPAASWYFHAPFLFGSGAGHGTTPGTLEKNGTPARAASGAVTGLLPADGRFDFRAPAVQASLAEVSRLVAAGALPKDPSGATVTALFNAGHLAAALNGPWFTGEIAPGVAWSVHPIPPLRGPDGALRPARPFLTVEGAFVSSRAHHPELAHALASHLAGPASALRRGLEGRQAVALKAAWDDPRLARDPVLSAFRAQLPETVPMDAAPAMQLVWEPGDLALAQVLRGARPEAAAEAAAARYAAVSRPSGAEAPTPADPLPWLILLGVGLVTAAVLLLRRGTRSDRSPEPPPAPLARGLIASAWVGPAALATAVLVLVPFVVGVGLAFFHHEAGRWTFVGASNFLDILSARGFELLAPLSFYYALLVTVLWTAANVVLHVGIGFGLALLLNRPLLALRPLYRVLLILPWAVPSYITALMWKGLFHTQFGAINGLLEALGLGGVAWFDHVGTAFFANVCANAWLGFPFMMVVSLGALQAVPKDLLEAAEVDGASAWQRFRLVTLPLVKPALVPAILLGIVWTFNQFNIIYLVSAGAPDNATDILISEAYRWAFARREQYGYAAAYALLIFGLLLAWSRVSMRLSRQVEAGSAASSAPSSEGAPARGGHA